jgi:putative oxidoreductase
MTKQTDILALAGRILIGLPFILSGFGKLNAAEATQGYIAAMGLPAPFLAYLGALSVELAGGILLVAGYRTRAVAVVLTGFTLLTAVFFHNNFGDQNQMIHFMKNLMIMGGLLQVVAYGAGKFSLDGRTGRSNEPQGAALSAAK